MDNYLMLDGKKIEISKETADNLRKQFCKKEPRHGDVVVTPDGQIRLVSMEEDGLVARNSQGHWQNGGNDLIKAYNEKSCLYTVKYNVFD